MCVCCRCTWLGGGPRHIYIYMYTHIHGYPFYVVQKDSKRNPCLGQNEEAYLQLCCRRWAALWAALLEAIRTLEARGSFGTRAARGRCGKGRMVCTAEKDWETKAEDRREGFIYRTFSWGEGSRCLLHCFSICISRIKTCSDFAMYHLRVTASGFDKTQCINLCTPVITIQDSVSLSTDGEMCGGGGTCVLVSYTMGALGNLVAPVVQLHPFSSFVWWVPNRFTQSGSLASCSWGRFCCKSPPTRAMIPAESARPSRFLGTSCCWVGTGRKPS